MLKIIDVVLDSSISIDFLGESELLLETEVVRVLQKGLKSQAKPISRSRSGFWTRK